jgi:molybdenum cofactor guanylyltransferase
VGPSTSSSDAGTPDASASASRTWESQSSIEGDSVTGVLLVGGASSRFGSPKALARLGGETLAERGWRALARCDERIAIGKAGDGLGLPFPVADDGESLRAPIAGVVGGLRAARHDVCVFLPVDCPLVTPAVLGALAEACADAAVPQTGPLPGAYRRTALPVLERRLAAGELALRGALAELETRIVAVDPGLLMNVNTMAELRSLGSA